MGVSEQGTRTSFQSISEVIMKKERENSERSGSFLIVLKEAREHQR